MSGRAVILYGPPASGKDEVTRALARLDSTFRHYIRLKVGTGRTDGYKMIGESELAELRHRGDVLFENTRYGNRYIVDRPRLRAMCKSGSIPVVHLGQVAGVRAVTSFQARWLAILLWCSRETSRERASARGTIDISSRLDAWDETARDLRENGTDDFAVCINTERHRPEDVALLIQEWAELLGVASEH
ncbi:MAG: guanylate kinase [Actinomycetota bacterium]|nr:guanylate kinase [Actinomycetota bacterium]